MTLQMTYRLITSGHQRAHWWLYGIGHDFSNLLWYRWFCNKFYRDDIQDGRWDQNPTRFNKTHDDVIKWKHFLRYWPFVRGINRPPVNSPQGQWRGALIFSVICVWINGWVNNREAGDLRRYRAHYDVIVMNTCSCHYIRFTYSLNISKPWPWLRRFQISVYGKWVKIIPLATVNVRKISPLGTILYKTGRISPKPCYWVSQEWSN